MEVDKSEGEEDIAEHPFVFLSQKTENLLFLMGEPRELNVLCRSASELRFMGRFFYPLCYAT